MSILRKVSEMLGLCWHDWCEIASRTEWERTGSIQCEVKIQRCERCGRTRRKYTGLAGLQ